MACVTYEPVAAEYGGTRVEAQYHEERGYWSYAVAINDDGGGGWQQYANGLVPECGRHDSEMVLAFCVKLAIK